jgi:hypothetical protein
VTICSCTKLVIPKKPAVLFIDIFDIDLVTKHQNIANLIIIKLKVRLLVEELVPQPPLDIHISSQINRLFQIIKKLFLVLLD